METNGTVLVVCNSFFFKVQFTIKD